MTSRFKVKLSRGNNKHFHMFLNSLYGFLIKRSKREKSISIEVDNSSELETVITIKVSKKRMDNTQREFVRRRCELFKYFTKKARMEDDLKTLNSLTS